MTSLILIIIGMLIGWNLPQPIWAKTLQDKAVDALRQKGILK
jgi:hypothetical protein